MSTIVTWYNPQDISELHTVCANLHTIYSVAIHDGDIFHSIETLKLHFSSYTPRRIASFENFADFIDSAVLHIAAIMFDDKDDGTDSINLLRTWHEEIKLHCSTTQEQESIAIFLFTSGELFDTRRFKRFSNVFEKVYSKNVFRFNLKDLSRKYYMTQFRSCIAECINLKIQMFDILSKKYEQELYNVETVTIEDMLKLFFLVYLVMFKTQLFYRFGLFQSSLKAWSNLDVIFERFFSILNKPDSYCLTSFLIPHNLSSANIKKPNFVNPTISSASKNRISNFFQRFGIADIVSMSSVYDLDQIKCLNASLYSEDYYTTVFNFFTLHELKQLLFENLFHCLINLNRFEEAASCSILNISQMYHLFGKINSLNGFENLNKQSIPEVWAFLYSKGSLDTLSKIKKDNVGLAFDFSVSEGDLAIICRTCLQRLSRLFSLDILGETTSHEMIIKKICNPNDSLNYIEEVDGEREANTPILHQVELFENIVEEDEDLEHLNLVADFSYDDEVETESLPDIVEEHVNTPFHTKSDVESPELDISNHHRAPSLINDLDLTPKMLQTPETPNTPHTSQTLNNQRKGKSKLAISNFSEESEIIESFLTKPSANHASSFAFVDAQNFQSPSIPLFKSSDHSSLQKKEDSTFSLTRTLFGTPSNIIKPVQTEEEFRRSTPSTPLSKKIAGYNKFFLEVKELTGDISLQGYLSNVNEMRNIYMKYTQIAIDSYKNRSKRRRLPLLNDLGAINIVKGDYFDALKNLKSCLVLIDDRWVSLQADVLFKIFLVHCLNNNNEESVKTLWEIISKFATSEVWSSFYDFKTQLLFKKLLVYSHDIYSKVSPRRVSIIRSNYSKYTLTIVPAVFNVYLDNSIENVEKKSDRQKILPSTLTAGDQMELTIYVESGINESIKFDYVIVKFEGEKTAKTFELVKTNVTLNHGHNEFIVIGRVSAVGMMKLDSIEFIYGSICFLTNSKRNVNLFPKKLGKIEVKKTEQFAYIMPANLSQNEEYKFKEHMNSIYQQYNGNHMMGLENEEEEDDDEVLKRQNRLEFLNYQDIPNFDLLTFNCLNKFDQKIRYKLFSTTKNIADCVLEFKYDGFIVLDISLTLHDMKVEANIINITEKHTLIKFNRLLRGETIEICITIRSLDNLQRDRLLNTNFLFKTYFYGSLDEFENDAQYFVDNDNFIEANPYLYSNDYDLEALMLITELFTNINFYQPVEIENTILNKFQVVINLIFKHHLIIKNLLINGKPFEKLMLPFEGLSDSIYSFILEKPKEDAKMIVEYHQFNSIEDIEIIEYDLLMNIPSTIEYSILPLEKARLKESLKFSINLSLNDYYTNYCNHKAVVNLIFDSDWFCEGVKSEEIIFDKEELTLTFYVIPLKIGIRHLPKVSIDLCDFNGNLQEIPIKQVQGDTYIQVFPPFQIVCPLVDKDPLFKAPH
eukprot:TRINITY_DN2161_c0_g4_i1.p1 TRINITY_DN2161_c0_g4~~TRINITY_DN2161_c0_g4_i1.p1  ORF type:complete len:1428 (+),score=405.15 TRINITY_DN2161_c0_g4_i1:129-4412(+)